MSGRTSCTVYIGNLDERVSDRVLYDILIQAGRVVDLYVPRDKETDRPKGYAFAEYETEEIADYAVRLFTGLVTLYNRTLRFAISGQDKLPNPPAVTMPVLNSSPQAGPPPVPYNHVEGSPLPARLLMPCRADQNLNYGQVHLDQSNGYRSRFEGTNYDYSRRVLGATLDSVSHPRLSRFNTSLSTNYPSY